MNSYFREYLDAPTERRGTHCIKWDKVDEIYNGTGLLPAWVADMDFRTVPQVAEALEARARHAIYGYTDTSLQDKAAEIGWLKRRYAFDCDPDWILYSPGVVDSLYFCVRALTDPGDSVIVMSPVYGPFIKAVQRNGRRLCDVEMHFDGTVARMDYEGIEKSLMAGARMILLCNPHNPTGRSWTRDELSRLVTLASGYGAIVVSDEIHSDFTLDGRTHTRILSLENSERCIMLTSATKSFNLAGLRQSSIIVKSPALRDKLQQEILVCHADMANIFGAVAQTAAYTYGDEWMDSVIEYITENRDYAVERLRRELPEVKAYPQEATYLLWLDFSSFGRTEAELKRFLVEKARLALNEGSFFGSNGVGHFRMNLATQRTNVKEALDRLIGAVKGS